MTKSFAIKCEFSCFVVTAIKGGLNTMIFAMGIDSLFVLLNKFDYIRQQNALFWCNYFVFIAND